MTTDSIDDWMNVTVDLEEQFISENKNEEEPWVALPEDTVNHINAVFETDTALQILGVNRKNSNSIGLDEMWEIKAETFKTPTGSPRPNQTTTKAPFFVETTEEQTNTLRTLIQWCLPNRQLNISNNHGKRSVRKSSKINNPLRNEENIEPYSPPKLMNNQTKEPIDRYSLNKCVNICFDIDSEEDSGEEEDEIDPSFYTQTL